jgi:urease accessory protein
MLPLAANLHCAGNDDVKPWNPDIRSLMEGKNMRFRPLPTVLAVPLLILTSGIAQAHTDVGHTSGLVYGFMHPFGGIDHLLAMLMVGVFAAQLRGHLVWLVPIMFVVVMGFGGGLGFSGVEVPFAELGIGLSVIILGLVVAFGFRASAVVAMALAGFFGVFHGYAHGAEMPHAAGALSYGMGFLFASTLLHLVGIAFGLFGAQGSRLTNTLIRSTGAAVAVAGISIVGGLI